MQIQSKLIQIWIQICDKCRSKSGKGVTSAGVTEWPWEPGNSAPGSSCPAQARCSLPFLTVFLFYMSLYFSIFILYLFWILFVIVLLLLLMGQWKVRITLLPSLWWPPVMKWLASKQVSMQTLLSFAFPGWFFIFDSSSKLLSRFKNHEKGVLI